MQSTCPYLGLITDSTTSTSFPSGDNACHRADPPEPLMLDYQRRCCLNPSYINCPGYPNGWEEGFPKELRRKLPSQSKSSPPKWAWTWMAGILILALLAGILLQMRGIGFSPVATIEGGLNPITPMATVLPTRTRTLPPTLISNLAPTPEGTLSPAFLNTLLPSPTRTVSPTIILTTPKMGPGLQTPFGSGSIKLAVYRALAGESLDAIAERFGTTRLVLEAINTFVPPERRILWEGDILVVCVNCENPVGLPKLSALFLDSGFYSLSELAIIRNTPVEEIRRWNGLDENDWIEGPRWVVVRAN